MHEEMIELDDRNFEDEVERATGFIMVDFWAPWCAPCRALAPAFLALAREYEGRVRFAKLNVDEAPHTAAAYGIRAIPTIALFSDGEPVGGVTGVVPRGMLADLLDAQLSKAA